MTDRFAKSPFQSILQRGDLGLSLEQRRELEGLDIEFRSATIRLMTDREVLELDAARARRSSSSGLGFTPESLASVDAITAKLRQEWLRALQAARSVLDPTQLLALGDDAIALPVFGADVSSRSEHNLEALVAQTVAGRLKDAKVIEIETTQAIAERLMSWAKTAAFVTAVPLALLVAALVVSGVSTWADFKAKIDKGKSEVDEQLATVNKSLEESKGTALRVNAEATDLEKRFGDVSAIISSVDLLSKKVEHLEQIKFSDSKGVSAKTRATVEEQLTSYRAYLQSIGYNPPSTDLNVVVNAEATGNAYYDGKDLVVGPDLVNMPDVYYHEYTLRVIEQIKPKSWNAASRKVPAIFYGFADYLTCSYQGSPLFGVAFAKEGHGSEGQRKQGYLRNLENTLRFANDSTGEKEQEPHEAGEVWGGVFWEIRRILGCRDDAVKCEVADRILLSSWTAVSLTPETTVDARLAAAIIGEIRRKGTADQATKAQIAFTQRGLVLPH